eukprot:scaffold153541_cov33-Tisochrysis_lutea.AAC.3
MALTADVPRLRRHSTGIRLLCSAYDTSAPTEASHTLKSATSASELSSVAIHSLPPSRTGA